MSTITSGTGIVVHPRMRLRRIEVKRDAGRRRLKRVAMALGVVVAGLAVVTLARSPLLDVDELRATGGEHTTASEVLAAAGIDRSAVSVQPVNAQPQWGPNGRDGYNLGGEQSGHVIFSEHLFTGDGIGTALQVLRIMEVTGRELDELASVLVCYPQVLVNVRVRERVDYAKIPAIAASIRRVEECVDGQGRLPEVFVIL